MFTRKLALLVHTLWGPQVNQDARRVRLFDGLETNILRVSPVNNLAKNGEVWPHHASCMGHFYFCVSVAGEISSSLKYNINSIVSSDHVINLPGAPISILMQYA